jgi:hypothetical protein
MYFGTAFAAYRSRIEAEVGHGPSANFFRFGEINSPCLDMSTGELDTGLKLKAAKANHQVLRVFLRDFYRPCSLGSLFSELFPGSRSPSAAQNPPLD